MAGEKEYLTEINRIYKESNEIYHTAAKALGLSDCAFWILYFLQFSETRLTQSALCMQLYEPKQTVHSALKKLEGEGYICFQRGSDRRSKYICLTEQGRLLAEYTASPVIKAEISALCEMGDEEKRVFISLFAKYTGLLRQNMSELSPHPLRVTGLPAQNHSKKEGGTQDGC